MKYLLPLLLLIVFFACQQDAPIEEPPTLPLPEADTLTLEVFHFQDSAVLAPDFAGSPQASFSVNTLIPKSEDEALNNLIQTVIGQSIAGEDAPLKVTNLAQTLRIASRELLFNYRKQAVDTNELIDFFNSYSLEYNHDTKAVINKRGLLTLATMHYAYTGGVHGNYATSVVSFSTDSTQLLNYEAVFLPNQEIVLSQLLTNKAKTLGIPYQTETVPVTDNFGFTEDGILFNYPPYEIASYADGEIEIVLPYGEISHLMTGLAEGVVLKMKNSGAPAS